jgi:DNA (cytosine-5)-methyltransferase 1
MKFAYYNEFDPKAAAWIKQLIKNGMIADGEVDERSITEVTADEIRGFTQHHFFAGIGGWSYSLRLAGWADDRPVCTASLPCQPFSVAGAQKGVDDDRHLLPHFIELVKQCNFQTIFGEQVPGAIKHGWLDDLCIEMEREKYAVGQIVIPAAAYGAFHIRQRLYWVAEKCVVPYNIKTVQHNEKDNDHEEMQQVRGSEASNRIQEQSTGKRQADVFLHRMWEEKDAGIPQEKQNVAQCKSAGEAQGKPDTRSEIQGESQREVPLVGVDTGDKKTISSNGERVRFGKP